MQFRDFLGSSVRKGLHIPTAVIVLLSIVCTGCPTDYMIDIVNYDPELAYNGWTVFNNMINRSIQAVDLEGNVMWEYQRWSWVIGDFEVLPNGDILFMSHQKLYILRLPDEIIWQMDAPSCHHCVIQRPNGNIVYLFHNKIVVEGWDLPWRGTGIREITMDTGETVWEWLNA